MKGVNRLSQLRSEFIQITSTGITDYVVLDLSGAVESVFNLQSGSSDGYLTNEPYAGSPRLHLIDTQGNRPLVTRSNDNRLYWVSAQVANAVLEVWVIRRV
mgnify:FL=1